MKKKSVEANDLVLKNTHLDTPLHHNYLSNQFYSMKKVEKDNQLEG